MEETGHWPQIGRFKVDPRLLGAQAVARCRIEECHAACCGHGVYADKDHAERIVAEAKRITPHLPSHKLPPARWFDDEISEDSDYPSGLRRGTQTVEDKSHPAGTRCVFLREDHFCALQVTAMSEGKHPWDLKPYYCALYPLVVLGDVLQIDDANELFSVGGTCQREEAAAVPLYETFEAELALALGQAGYEELKRLAQANLNQRK